ncbi:erythromycin esterase family protein [Myxococcaceae bacterium JPH2]|nr:erythromycin esterase family protein [Myxococcaceae bacterium JPH2]
MKLLRMLWLVLPLACASTSTPLVSTVAANPRAPAVVVTTATVEGTVQSAAKEPVAGAVVALIPAREDWNPDRSPPAGRMLTGPDGRFRFEGIAPGNYGVTVSALRHEAVFTEVRLTAAATPRQLDVMLAPARHVVRGGVKSEAGAPLAGVWLDVGRYSDFLGDMLYVQTDAQGAFEVALPVGEYRIALGAEGFLPTGRQVRIVEGTTSLMADFLLRARPETAPPAPEVVSWVKQSLVPLSSVEAGHGFADLHPLKPWLSKARIVSLGEATHGSREFFQLKHRMLEFLATELGFTVFAIEASFGESLAINDYVLTGKGDPAKALTGLYFWTWDTEEVLSLIRWMRAYNADPRHPRKLKFYGVDMQTSAASAQAILDYFARVEPVFHQRLVGPLTPFTDKAQGESLRTLESGKVLAGIVAEVEAWLRRHPSRKGAEKAHALVGEHARVLGQFAARTGSPAADESFRDLAMAQNARWILEHEGPQARMVLWAHNSHVATALEQGRVPMGKHLRQALGQELYVFGFAFNQGEFQAIHVPSEPNEPRRGLSVHSLPPADVGMLEGALSQAGSPLFALNLRDLPVKGAATEYFSQRRYTRNFGAVFSKDIQPVAVRAVSAYDGLLFVERTEAAIPTPTGRRPPPPPPVSRTP